jgi:hypothetical protein
MARYPAMNPQGGRAALVSTRMRDHDVARLLRLAAHRKVTPSTMARELLQLALDMLDNGPPHERADA